MKYPVLRLCDIYLTYCLRKQDEFVQNDEIEMIIQNRKRMPLTVWLIFVEEVENSVNYNDYCANSIS